MVLSIRSFRNCKSFKEKELVNQIEEAAKKETNNGVRNVYLKAIKEVNKNKS